MLPRTLMVRVLTRLLPNRPAILPVLRGDLAGRRLCANHALRPHYLLGAYEPALVAAIKRHLRPGQVAYDIGANVGYLTMVMARQVGPAGRVLAFEPAPSAFRALATNALLNRDLPLDVYQIAIGDKVGVESFSWFDYDLVSRLGDHSAAYPDAHIARVAIDTLDHFVATFDASAPALVKIDVEGAENQVVAGMTYLIGAQHPTLIIEVHSPKNDHLLTNLLARLGYSRIILSQHKPLHLAFIPPGAVTGTAK